MGFFFLVFFAQVLKTPVDFTHSGGEKRRKCRSDDVTIAENKRILSGRPKKKGSQFGQQNFEVIKGEM